MQTARVVVPIVIAVIVLHLFGRLGPDATPEPTSVPTADVDEGSYFPMGEGFEWTYDVRGVFVADGPETQQVFTRTVLRKRSDDEFQLTDSRDGKVEDTYYVARTLKGLEVTSISLDKRRILLLPLSFGPGSIFNPTSRLRATADDDEEELDLGAGFGPRPCLRVRYDRFYDKDSPPRPDWSFEGYRWYCQGLGIVKEDLRDVQVPRTNGRVDIRPTWEVRLLTAMQPSPVK